MKPFVLLPAGVLVVIVAVFLLIPNALVWLAFSGSAFLGGDWWRILTYPFVHATTAHLLENVLSLSVASLLAFEVEMTAVQYIAAFVASVALVAFADILFFPTLVILGVSAAVFAVYGAFAMKGSVFISKSWLVAILGATVWARYLTGQATGSAPHEIIAQTLLHFLGFAAGVAIMIVCLEVAKSTKRRVLTA